MSRSTWILIFIAIFFGIIFWSLASEDITSQAPYYIKTATLQTTKVEINGIKVEAEVAKSEKARNRGLSGRVFLPENRGMIFVFDQSGIYTITMRDMKFSIDIIWIKDNKVVDLTSKAQIPSVNVNIVQEYSSKFEVNYILEVNEEFISKNNIRIGDDVKTGLSN